MKIIASAGEGGFTRQLIEPDLYYAVCCRLIDIGTIDDAYQGKPKKTHKILVSWELPDVRQIFNPDKGPEPRIISKEFTLSLGDQAHLRRILKSWRGRDFTPDELREFNIVNLLGARCMLNIGHYQGKDGNTYEEITAVTKAPKDYQPTHPPQMPVQGLAYDEFDFTLFDSLSEKLKDKIKSSDEYKRMTSQETVASQAEQHDDYDDLPF
ncbi:phage replication initiation protein, NGO0469 family [Tellurirhabdus bombi]|uniref:phage replication initiation protein, NGO0469 family n=1 Tax=Tellurirhabdus bombi TaxID=2907205 RepID=UPI001F2ABEBD|nr:hypothetical protein [Tellurirhabdus bombi]